MIRLVFLGLIAAAYAVVCFVSPYSFWMLDEPHFAQLAYFPEGPDAMEIGTPLRRSGIEIPTNRPDLPPYNAGIKIGYSYRTFSALKLPLFVYADQGPVIYGETSTHTKLTPMDDASRALVTKKLGRDPLAGFGLPYLRSMWGLLFFAALAIWLFFQYRHEARRRAKSGIL
jgi:hypothetical protein